MPRWWLSKLVVGFLIVLPGRGLAQSIDVAIPEDPALTTGVLDNGVRFYIRHNDQPENRAEIWLVVNAGSVLEDPDQMGLAHFVEHMAFNGTEHFEKQALIDYLESIGMEFGPSVNAFTDFDETVYQLRVPTDDPAVLGTAVQILEDWAHGLSFDPAEVDKERGVVLEEWRLGLGAGARMRDTQLPVLLNDSRYAERLPIGDPEVLRSFPVERVVDFYRDWYRPELMAVVAVGDFDVASIERLIREHFAGIAPLTEDRIRPVFAVPEHDETLVAIATDPEATASQVAIAYKVVSLPDSTEGGFRDDLVAVLFDGMFNKRLFEISRLSDAPFLFGGSGQGRLVRNNQIYQLSAAVKDGGIERGFTAILSEAERVKRHGFTASELERQKAELLRGYERAYAERENRDSRGLASELQRAYLDGEVVPGIEWEFEAVSRLLSGISLDEIDSLADLRQTAGNRVVLVSAPERPDVSVPDEGALLSVFQAVEASVLDPYVDVVTEAPLVRTPPTPGSIRSETRLESIGVTVLDLSNGVQVLLKPTDFKDDEVILQASSPGGTSLAPDDIYASATMAATLVAQGGLGALDVVELQKALTGKAAGVSPNIATLTEGLSGGASPQDLEVLFQLVYLYFTEPRRDPEAVDAFKQRIMPIVANRGAAPRSHFGDTLAITMAQGSPRRAPPGPGWVESLDLDDAFEFYTDRFADASDFTFVLVGAFDESEVRGLVTTYLAGLPALDRVESWRDEGIKPPTGVVRKLVRKGVEPQSQTQLVFTGDFDYADESRMAIRLMASALEIRMREVLREDLGGTYSVGVNAGYSRFPDPSYSVSVGFGSDPARRDELLSAVFQEIAAFKEAGPSDEDVQKVLEAERRTMETNRESNPWWAGQLLASLFEGLDPERLIRDELFDVITPAVLQAAAVRYLNVENYVEVALVPEDFGGSRN